MLNIGWFSTGRDEAARQLLVAVQQAIDTGEIDGKISFVFSNREPGEAVESDSFFDLVRTYQLPLICLPHRQFKASAEKNSEWRHRYDMEANCLIANFTPEICVLAGYMLIIGRELCQRYTMINLHPALPGGPTGSWQEVIWSLINSEAEKTGVMTHLVTPEVDRGPTIAYCSFPIKGGSFDEYRDKDDRASLFQLIRRRELAREFPLVILTLKALCKGELKVQDNRVLDRNGNIFRGYDLTKEINCLLGESLL